MSRTVGIVSGMHSFDRFEAFRAAEALVLSVYRQTAQWPTPERFGLARQVREAAYSIAANIAEGSVRKGPKEFRRFLDIAMGSLAELTFALRLAHHLGYLPDEAFRELERERDATGRLVWGLTRAMSRAAGATALPS